MEKYLPKIIGALLNLASYFSPGYSAKLAIRLFSTPRKGKLDSQASKFLQSSIQDEVVYQQIPIKTYHWPGKGDTVLLAHGWESNSFRWKDLIILLRRHSFNIIALDAPAHGASGGKLFNALIYSECMNIVAQKFKAKTIIGHSVGGMSVIFFQYKYQLPSIKKLVLLGAPADFIGVLSRYVQMMGYNKRVSKAMSGYILKHYHHLPEYFSPADFSKKIRARGLVIHDKKDSIIPYEDCLLFEQNYANAKFVATSGYGHGLKSKEVNQHILNFLRD